MINNSQTMERPENGKFLRDGVDGLEVGKDHKILHRSLPKFQNCGHIPSNRRTHQYFHNSSFTSCLSLSSYGHSHSVVNLCSLASSHNQHAATCIGVFAPGTALSEISCGPLKSSDESSSPPAEYCYGHSSAVVTHKYMCFRRVVGNAK